MFADSDNSVGISELVDCMSYLSQYDVVLPDRYDGGRNEMPVSRRFMGISFNMLVRSFTGINAADTQCGYKLFKTDKLKESMSRVGITNAFF